MDELRKRADLRWFAQIDQVLSTNTISRFLSSISEDQFVRLINAVLQTQYLKPRCRSRRTYLIDSTAITLDLNVFKKRYRKADPVEKDYVRAYSTTNGYVRQEAVSEIAGRTASYPLEMYLPRHASPATGVCEARGTTWRRTEP